MARATNKALDFDVVVAGAGMAGVVSAIAGGVIADGISPGVSNVMFDFLLLFVARGLEDRLEQVDGPGCRDCRWEGRRRGGDADGRGARCVPHDGLRIEAS